MLTILFLSNEFSEQDSLNKIQLLIATVRQLVVKLIPHVVAVTTLFVVDL